MYIFIVFCSQFMCQFSQKFRALLQQLVFLSKLKTPSQIWAVLEVNELEWKYDNENEFNFGFWKTDVIIYWFCKNCETIQLRVLGCSMTKCDRFSCLCASRYVSISQRRLVDISHSFGVLYIMVFLQFQRIDLDRWEYPISSRMCQKLWQLAHSIQL